MIILQIHHTKNKKWKTVGFFENKSMSGFLDYDLFTLFFTSYRRTESVLSHIPSEIVNLIFQFVRIRLDSTILTHPNDIVEFLDMIFNQCLDQKIVENPTKGIDFELLYRLLLMS